MKQLIFLMVCAFCLSACRGHSQTASSSSGDALDLTFEGSNWLHPAPDTFYAPAARNTEKTIEFHEVVAHEALAAVYSLDKDAFREISPDEAKLYTGAVFKPETGEKLYLVRAAFHPSGTGDYEVLELGSQLLVSYDCLGHHISPEKSALVIALDKVPSDIFIEIHMAE